MFAGVPSGIDRDVAQAPPACKPALYDGSVLRKLAKTYRLDWQEQGTDHITVSSSCTRISGDAIRDAVIAKIKADSNVKNLKLEIVFDKRNLEVEFPANNNPDFQLENFSYDPTNKQFRTNLTVQTPRGSYFLPVTGRVLLKRSVPVLAHRVEGGSLIGSDDLDWIDLPEERVSADVVTESNQLVGREVRRDMPQGEILRSRDITPPRLVQRGSLVTMKIETPYILVTAQGKAEQDGAIGETIRITNTQSNRVVEGVVTAHGVVEIRSARKIALAE